MTVQELREDIEEMAEALDALVAHTCAARTILQELREHLEMAEQQTSDPEGEEL